jgi:NAD(P)-dependent dehydrogenase (short-subunit alcohol dehydrogenase family)
MSTTSQKVAIVTGGATGIGRAIAQALVATGAAVLIAGRDQQRGEAAAAELGGNTVFVPTDVSQESDVQRLLAIAMAAWTTLSTTRVLKRGWEASKARRRTCSIRCLPSM